MSEADLASSVGPRLRAAREAQGLSVEEAAGRLRLMHRQIDAMEREDFESLGQPVFARGFVRNYARLLADGPSLAALVPSPVMRAMQDGSIARVEELTGRDLSRMDDRADVYLALHLL